MRVMCVARLTSAGAAPACERHCWDGACHALRVWRIHAVLGTLVSKRNETIGTFMLGA